MAGDRASFFLLKQMRELETKLKLTIQLIIILTEYLFWKIFIPEVHVSRFRAARSGNESDSFFVSLFGSVSSEIL